MIPVILRTTFARSTLRPSSDKCSWFSVRFRIRQLFPAAAVNATLECVVCVRPAASVSVAVTSPTPRSVRPAAGFIFRTCTPTVRRAGLALLGEAWLLDTVSAATTPIATAAESSPS